MSQKYKWWAFAAIFAVAIAASAGVLIRLLIEQIVNNIESNEIQAVVFFSLLYPVAYFLVALVWRISGVTGSFWLLGAPKEATDILSQYSSYHSHSYFSDRFAGSLSNKISNVSRSMEEFVATFYGTS